MSNVAQFEIREFRTKKFTGADLVDIIKENELHGFELFSFKKEHVNMTGVYQQDPYVGVLQFRRPK